jgi:transcriptional regulator with XRE-family HTH domain
VVSDGQVRLLRQKRMEGKTQEAAAAAAGMSVRTARQWERGPWPSESKPARHWRTRPDPFEEVWESKLVPLLERDTERELQATTLLDWLGELHPGRFAPGQLRTLQRRMREWRALHGPAREVYFEQQAVPGREAQLDFTHANSLQVTIAGEPFDHLLFELLLRYSGWRFVQLAYGETYEALVEGLQNALWTLGGVPEVARSDNLSAATHELKKTGGRALNERFAAVLAHYGLCSTRIRPGQSHENGAVEQGHYRLKSALAQALVLRGSRDFPSVEAYAAFVQEVVAKLNRKVEAKLAEERAQLRPLPPKRVPAYTRYSVRVRKWSTIRIHNKTYSVPSRLIDHRVDVHQHADVVEVYYAGKLVERMPRLRGGREHRIDYRHVIWSLVRKPGAFARYRYREELFPTPVFRAAYDALCERRGERADIEYVRILHLAASTLEATVERALAQQLASGEAFDYTAVRALAAPERPKVPALAVLAAPDLGIYDALLGQVRS